MSTTPENDRSLPDDSRSSVSPIILNLRKAVRYGRDDIKALLSRKSFFHSSKPFDIEVHDISTRGAHVISKRKLSIDGTYVLIISFGSDKTFEIPGKVIHKKPSSDDSYGFKFDAYNDELGDYLLNSQTDLVFK